MDVEIYRAVLTIEGRRERLTKAIAKQFPALSGRIRWQAAEKGEPQPEPICKVAGHVLGEQYTWMYLVEDPLAGLAWVAAMQTSEEYAEVIVANGGWVDHPEERN